MLCYAEALLSIVNDSISVPGLGAALRNARDCALGHHIEPCVYKASLAISTTVLQHTFVSYYSCSCPLLSLKLSSKCVKTAPRT